MHFAYLLFDLLVVLGPAVLAQLPGSTGWRCQRLGLAALALGSVPWVVWDVLVAGAHWDFDARYVMGPRVLGLPLEEWGFFVAVPFACLYTWERVVRGPPARDPRLAAAVWAGASLLLLGPLIGLLGAPPYTALALGSTGAPFVADLLLGGRVFHNARAWVWLALVLGLTFVFDNLLTGLPVVVYDPTAQLDVRLLTMPIEDLGFGMGHLGVVLVLYEAWRSRWGCGAPALA